MANAESARTTTAALLFYFSAALLLAGRDAIADLVLATLDRFHLDGRSLLDLATKRNMILLCHAILLVILRDAGVLGAPARRRAATVSLVVAAASADEEPICSAPARKDAEVNESGRRQPRQSPHQPPATAAIPGAAPALALEPEQAAGQQTPLLSKEIVLVEKATTTTSYLVDDHDLDEQAAATASAADGKGDSDRRIILADDDDERDVNAAAEEEAPELADDRRIEEFITKQWSEIRQEEPAARRQVRVPTSGDTNMLA